MGQTAIDSLSINLKANKGWILCHQEQYTEKADDFSHLFMASGHVLLPINIAPQTVH